MKRDHMISTDYDIKAPIKNQLKIQNEVEYNSITKQFFH